MQYSFLIYASNDPTYSRLSHLHTLAISQTNPGNLDPEQFKNFTVELETLKIEDGSVKSLKGGMFKYIRGVKTLDLTDNNINSVDAQAFVEVSPTGSEYF